MDDPGTKTRRPSPRRSRLARARPGRSQFVVELDRRAAIRLLFERARPGDAVLAGGQRPRAAHGRRRRAPTVERRAGGRRGARASWDSAVKLYHDGRAARDQDAPRTRRLRRPPTERSPQPSAPSAAAPPSERRQPRMSSRLQRRRARRTRPKPRPSRPSPSCVDPDQRRDWGHPDRCRAGAAPTVAETAPPDGHRDRAGARRAYRSPAPPRRSWPVRRARPRPVGLRRRDPDHLSPPGRRAAEQRRNQHPRHASSSTWPTKCWATRSAAPNTTACAWRSVCRRARRRRSVRAPRARQLVTRRTRPRHAVQPRYAGLGDVLVVLIVVGLAVLAGALLIPAPVDQSVGAERAAERPAAVEQHAAGHRRDGHARAGDARCRRPPPPPGRRRALRRLDRQRVQSQSRARTRPRASSSACAATANPPRTSTSGRLSSTAPPRSAGQPRAASRPTPPAPRRSRFNVGGATPNYPVQVRVFAQVDDQQLSWSTTFTPR